jgi:hypothetical protein
VNVQMTEVAMAYELGQTCMLVDLGLTRSECASWVQAWGSIGAIFSAACLAWWQLRKGEKAAVEQRRVADRARLIAIASVLTKAVIALELAEEAARNFKPSTFKFAASELADAQTQIARLPIFDIPHPALVLQLQFVRRFIEDAIQMGIVFTDNNDEETRPETIKIMSDRLRRVKAARGLCTACIKEVSLPSDAPLPEGAYYPQDMSRSDADDPPK